MNVRPAHTTHDALERLLVMDDQRTLPNSSYYGSHPLPSQAAVAEIGNDLLALFFPGYFGPSPASDGYQWEQASRFFKLRRDLAQQIYLAKLAECGVDQEPGVIRKWSEETTDSVLSTLPQVRELLELDVQAAYDRDPAANSILPIPMCYPGIRAVAVYRFAHELHVREVALLAIMFSTWAKSQTGIDIHPAAKIGPGFFIDHGTGVVIGETAEIGKNVTLYQGVTLGSWNFPRDSQGQIIRGAKRHPTLQDGVTVYANASVLGGDTVVGCYSDVGANVTLRESLERETVLWREKQHLQKRSKKGSSTKPKSSLGAGAPDPSASAAAPPQLTYRERYPDRYNDSVLPDDGCPNCGDVDERDEFGKPHNATD